MPEVPEVVVDRERLLRMYRQLLLVRRFEEQAAKAYTLKKIKGFCHLYIGQESVAVGALEALNADDVVITAYRDHGHALARGIPPNAVMSELFGKADGCTKGVGGSMHLSSAEHHLWGGYGIVGGHIPLGAGAAFAAWYRGEPRVSMTFFGEGAAQQGAFYEALELSQLWKLPAIFVCENNGYAMGTAVERASYETDMSRRGAGIGLRHWRFEAFDVVDVYRNACAAVAHARSGEGPVLLEAVTYRYQGHSMSDPGKYRSKEEVEAAKESRDGLVLARRRLLAEHGLAEAELAALEEEIRAEAKAAYVHADEAPDPDPAHLYDYTWAG